MKLNEKQLAQVDRQIKRLIAGDSYYGKILKEKKIIEWPPYLMANAIMMGTILMI